MLRRALRVVGPGAALALVAPTMPLLTDRSSPDAVTMAASTETTTVFVVDAERPSYGLHQWADDPQALRVRTPVASAFELGDSLRIGWADLGAGSPRYMAAQAMLDFDTSSLPDDAVLTSATLVLTLDDRSRFTDGLPVIEARRFAFDGIANDDWRSANQFDGLPLAGAVDLASVSSVVPGAHVEVPITDVGQIDRRASTPLVVSTADYRTDAVPTGFRRPSFAAPSAVDTTARPQLLVTYAVTKVRRTTTTTSPTTTSPTTTSPTTTRPTTTSVPTTTTTAAPPPPSNVDLRLFPFASSSPWNRRMPPTATFAAASAPATLDLLEPKPGGYAPGFNVTSYSHPVYLAAAVDPYVTYTWTATGQRFTFQCPSNAVPASGTDRHLHCAQPDGKTLYEMWNVDTAARTAGYIVRTDLTGPGVGQGGVRAYGGSAVGGLIRTADVQKGSIDHALALALVNDQLKVGPVWPATSEDGNAASSYSGTIPMGTFVAIPPTVDLSRLGLNASALMVATALQRYGAYVVDRSGAWVLYGEPSLPSAFANDVWPSMDVIRQQLRIVTNNAP